MDWATEALNLLALFRSLGYNNFFFIFRFRPKMSGLFIFLFFGPKMKLPFRYFLFFGRKRKILLRSASKFYLGTHLWCLIWFIVEYHPLTKVALSNMPSRHGSAICSGALILIFLQRATFMTSIKCRRWQFHCGGFCSYLDSDPIGQSRKSTTLGVIGVDHLTQFFMT